MDGALEIFKKKNTEEEQIEYWTVKNMASLLNDFERIKSRNPNLSDKEEHLFIRVLLNDIESDRLTIEVNKSYAEHVRDEIRKVSI